MKAKITSINITSEEVTLQCQLNGQNGVIIPQVRLMFNKCQWSLPQIGDTVRLIGYNPMKWRNLSTVYAIQEGILDGADTTTDCSMFNSQSSISIKAGTININSTDQINITVNGISMQISPSGINIDGGLVVNGNITANNATIAGTLFSTHMHSGVQSGGSNTGPVVP